MLNLRVEAVANGKPRELSVSPRNSPLLFGVGTIIAGFLLFLSERDRFPGYIIGPIPGSEIYLDIVGFLIPLGASMSFLYAFLLRRDKPKATDFSIYLFAISILGVIDYLLSPPWYRAAQTSGSHLDSAMYVVTIGFLLSIVIRGWVETATILSYPLFFLLGVLSDVDAISHLKGPLYFGGSGIFDGDFLFPLIFFGFLALMSVVHQKRTNRKKERDSGHSS